MAGNWQGKDSKECNLLTEGLEEEYGQKQHLEREQKGEGLKTSQEDHDGNV